MQAVLLSFGLFVCFFTSGKSQSCEKSTLKRPDNVDLSRLDSSYDDGKAVRLPCVIGYTGLHRATCRGGKWELRRGLCQKKPCGHPGDTPNGDFNLATGDDFVFGSIVQYTCKTGYRMMSRNSERSCVNSGWDNDIPVCEVVKCPVIQVAPNVRASGNVEDGSYGDVIHFECQSQDMQLNGKDEIYCTSEGKWSDLIPTCKEIQCETPAMPNGKVTNAQPVYKWDDVLRYTCDEGYQARVGRTKCSKLGWNPKPECEENTCMLPHQVSTGTTRLPAGKNIFKPKDMVDIHCEEGYRTSTFKERDSFHCGLDGEWSDTPDCQEIFCSRPRSSDVNIPYWPRIFSYKYKETLPYSCNSNYKRPAEDATCQLEGWKPKPRCIRKEDCFQPVIKNGFIKPNKDYMPYKDTVVFSCKRGFKLNNEGWWQKSICTKGSWSSTPKCIAENQCAAPRAADNVIYPHVKENYSDGQFQEFKCEPGYTSDSGRIKCDNGQWEKPDCKRESGLCNAPPDVEKGIIVPSYEKIYRNEAKVTYACHQSHKMNGEDTITCNSGRWTDPPTCIEIQCEKPDIPQGQVTNTKSVYKWDDDLRYTCDEGYKAREGRTKCSKLGWTPKPECKENTCMLPHQVSTGTTRLPAGKNIFKPKERVDIDCDEGYRTSTFKERDSFHCGLDGEWSYTPDCQEIFCSRPLSSDVNIPSWAQRASYKYKETLRYSCYSNYKRPAEDVTCQVEGWKPKTLCIRKEDCFQPVIKNGFIKPNKDYVPNKDTVVFSCKSGFKLNPEGLEQESTCFKGSWSSTPKCIAEDQCTAPRAADNVMYPHLEETYSDGQFQEFQCEPGYTSDSGRIKCDNGQWEKPDCKRENERDMCDKPEGGNMVLHPDIEEYINGSIVRYTCKDPFTGKPGEEITCVNGRWTDKVSCTLPPGFCGPPPEVEFSDVDGTSKQYYKHDDMVKFQCQDGYILVGESGKKTCRNGKWHCLPFSCEPRAG
ncbi:coagulation factor XIII B chain-like isoform X2 [Clupea harengus]|uniref:Coagulation factor XIII B chain-like isoform X2 n=1 Tax=Clupea harengus TaxID=7950 RepID=A0A6P8FX91_CLUHA|nr:coagulation factor XIII B chain-like isoform X2 [Clupea harengus]